jgi:FtsH-binding integral membrane protein
MEYIACIFAGGFLVNAIPHFVHGVSGNRFPTPFSKPPGRGLSAPWINTIWGLVNFVIFYFLFQAGQIMKGDRLGFILFFVGASVIGLMLSLRFSSKYSE